MNDFENDLKKQPLRRVPGHWRAQILARAAEEARRPEHEPWWAALLWPSRKAWGALAAAWVLIIAFSAATHEHSASEPTPQAVQVRMAMEEKRRLQAEIEDAVVRYEQDSPKPRSEIAHWPKAV